MKTDNQRSFWLVLEGSSSWMLLCFPRLSSEVCHWQALPGRQDQSTPRPSLLSRTWPSSFVLDEGVLLDEATEAGLLGASFFSPRALSSPFSGGEWAGLTRGVAGSWEETGGRCEQVQLPGQGGGRRTPLEGMCWGTSYLCRGGASTDSLANP